MERCPAPMTRLKRCFRRSRPMRVFSDLAVKFSEAAEYPFQRLKVKVKREIVTFGVPEAEPAVTTVNSSSRKIGNALISDPDVVVIDTRNDYEVDVGTFEGARNPQTRAFNEFPDYVRRTLSDDRTRKIAMFCTGGIRCEKASAFLLHEGYTNVFPTARRHPALSRTHRTRGESLARRVLRLR